MALSHSFALSGKDKNATVNAATIWRKGSAEEGGSGRQANPDLKCDKAPLAFHQQPLLLGLRLSGFTVLGFYKENPTRNNQHS